MSIETDTWPTTCGPWYGAPMAAPKGKNTPKAKEAVPAIPAPGEEPGAASKLADVNTITAIAVAFATLLVFVVGPFVWLASEFKEVRSEIVTSREAARQDVDDVRKTLGEHTTALARHGDAIERLTERVANLEQRMDRQLGPELDAGAGPVWSPDHVTRRTDFCSAKCDDDACLTTCSAAYNACGIRCPSTLVSACFRDCVKEIK